MDSSDSTIRLELGCDHGAYGAYDLGRVSESTFWALSAGADRLSPSTQFKGDVAVPNEDGLLIVESGDRVLMAVADAHYGAEASHEILTELSERFATIPAEPGELRAGLTDLRGRPVLGDYASETTLVVAVLDRAERAGFGVSYGDSSFAVVGSMGFRSPLEHKEMKFVSFARPETFAIEHAESFEFTADPEDLVLAFTDGIDECHYREPATSVTPEIMAGLYVSLGSDSEAYVRGIVELALKGVDGSPGGQDNIAVVAVRV